MLYLLPVNTPWDTEVKLPALLVYASGYNIPIRCRGTAEKKLGSRDIVPERTVHLKDVLRGHIGWLAW